MSWAWFYLFFYIAISLGLRDLISSLVYNRRKFQALSPMKGLKFCLFYKKPNLHANDCMKGDSANEVFKVFKVSIGTCIVHIVQWRTSISWDKLRSPSPLRCLDVEVFFIDRHQKRKEFQLDRLNLTKVRACEVHKKGHEIGEFVDNYPRVWHLW